MKTKLGTLVSTLAVGFIASSTSGQDSVKSHTFGESAYAFIPSGQIAWAEAKSQCEGMGGHLATISNAQENEFVKSLVAGKRVWLGGTRKNRGWTWVDETDWEFTDFDGAQRLNFLVIEAKSNKWASARPEPANPVEGFLCEWAAARAPTEIAMRQAEPEADTTGTVTFFGVPIEGSGSSSPRPDMTKSRPNSRPRPSIPEVKGPDYTGNFVEIVAGENSTIGLLAKLEDKLVALVSAEKLSGVADFRVRTEDGSLKSVGFAVSKSGNLAAIVLEKPATAADLGFEIQSTEDGEIAIDSPILIHDGMADVTAAVDSVDELWLTTDAQMNSGGVAAAIDPKSGKLIGIATAGVDVAGQPNSEDAEGETIVRIAPNLSLQEVNWARWVKEREALEGLQAATTSFLLLVEQLTTDRVIYLGDYQTTGNPLRDPLAELNRTLGKTGIADADRTKARESFLRQATTASQRDVSAFQLSHFSGAFHQTLYRAVVAEREKIKSDIEMVSSNENLVQVIELSQGSAEEPEEEDRER
ncbi:MAG: hypothetical protein ACI8UO_005266 [Verrucomicrobiales bacterium]|jgi:hypothetical protein